MGWVLSWRVGCGYGVGRFWMRGSGSGSGLDRMGLGMVDVFYCCLGTLQASKDGTCHVERFEVVEVALCRWHWRS